VEYRGRGIYYREATRIYLLPAPPDTGVVFNSIPASLKNVSLVNHTLGLKKGMESILGIEHLLAAIYGMEIDNVLIEVEGRELPFGDGSSYPFVVLLKRAGRRRQNKVRSPIKIRAPIFIRGRSSLLSLLPSPQLFISFLFSLNSERQLFSAPITRENFERIAKARTFGPYNDPVYLSSLLGIELREKEGFLFPKKERFAKEPVYHKVLDILGCLPLLGKPLRGAIFAYRSGHRDILRLLREVERRYNEGNRYL